MVTPKITRYIEERSTAINKNRTSNNNNNNISNDQKLILDIIGRRRRGERELELENFILQGL